MASRCWLFTVASALAVCTFPARARAARRADGSSDASLISASPAPPSTSKQDDASLVSASPTPPPTAQASNAAFAVTLGGGYYPASPGAYYAGMLQLERVLRVGKGDFRFGAMGAYETSYYQSSVLFLGGAGENFGFGNGLYALGYGVDFGYGSFSPKDSYNADSGGSGLFMLYLTPALFRFGPLRRIEVGLDGGAIYLFGFSEIDPFEALTVGYVTW